MLALALLIVLIVVILSLTHSAKISNAVLTAYVVESSESLCNDGTLPGFYFAPGTDRYDCCVVGRLIFIIPGP